MQKTVQETLNKQLLRRKPTAEQFTAFTEALRNLKDSIQPNETEEHNKNYVQKFLCDAFYGNTNLVNTAGYIDCAIYQTKDANSPIDVIIEAKAPSSNEFPSRNNLNCKAVQELVLYFMRQRFQKKNITLKHLIATNGFEWFFIDASEFEKYFAADKKFEKLYREYDNKELLFSGTKDFYAEIAKPKIDQVKQNINFVYIDIRALKTESEKLRMFRMMQPAHLLKQFKYADSNKLNTAFYNELLHIIGLEEHTKNGKSIIERKDSEHRDEFSLLENAIYQLEDYNLSDEETFDIALNLVITWINRILFLKLLESQLISYHGQKSADQYRFLEINIIKNYDQLNELFFKVLASPVEQRSQQVKDKFVRVPYLNSSLFEMTSNEKVYFRITGLTPGDMPLFTRTVLKDINGHPMKMKMDTLEYLFRFLDAYDFGSEQSDDITQSENKTLINASVLGLIFEKINGYKDGSFFTPGFITQYMCREAIDQTIISKFNEHFGFSCQTLTDIHNQDFDKQEAISILDKITLCDPAVGSGHFLVSALNYLIVIRAELGLLYDENGKRLKDYNFTIDNDELIVTDEEGEIFHYNPNNIESQRVQKTLFDLKRQIIENNLFGVDINPNSVNICRLRLWIELLKNAYYKGETHELETLPNIDINIKCGNSLISRYPVRVGYYGGFNDNQLKAYIDAYKKAVHEYKAMSNKEQKKVVADQIEHIKYRLLNPTSQLNLFEQKKEVSKEEQLLQNANPLEWMIEFPEVLDENGVFKGFDIVIGNPPYISSKDLKDEVKKIYKKQYVTARKQMDLYALFIELATKLIKPNAISSYIVPDSLIGRSNFETTRKSIICDNTILRWIHLNEVFENATVANVLYVFKHQTTQDYTFTYVKANNIQDWQDGKTESVEIKKSIVEQTENLKVNFSTSTQSLLLSKIKDNQRLQSELLMWRGEEMGRQASTILDVKEDDCLPLLAGDNVHRYAPVNWSRYIRINDVGKANYAKTKILIRQLGTRINATIDFDGCITLQSIYNLALEKQNDSYLKYILGLLNSRLCDFVYKITAGDKQTFQRIILENIKQLPVPSSTLEQQQPIIDLVDAILEAKRQDSEADTTNLEAQIDALVYQLYNLTPDEIALIKQS